MLKSYRTFTKLGVSEIVEKKSRFIGQSAYVETEEQARDFVAGVKKEHNSASHHVFAFRLDGPAVLERQSDDGEPSGTAGLPVLDVLRGENVINGIIVVTRYFGGTLLGTGGLVRAYGKTAKKCAGSSGIATKQLFASISIFTDYAASGKVEYELIKDGVILQDTIYTDSVCFEVFTPAGEEEALCKKIADWTQGGAKAAINQPIYAAVIDGEFILM